MAEYSLTLSALKYANVTNFSRPFGTKKTALQNSGSLTTEEFNIANALPFDIQRPLVIAETSTISNIQYDAKVVINAASTTLTLESTGVTEGIMVTLMAAYDATIVFNNTSSATTISDVLHAGEIAKLVFIGGRWEVVQDLGEVKANPSDKKPFGALIVDGSAYSKVKYPRLANFLGIRYNLSTDQSNVFRVPDYTNLTMIGRLVSETEQFTGRYWIDGRPIYSKMFVVNGPATSDIPTGLPAGSEILQMWVRGCWDKLTSDGSYTVTDSQSFGNVIGAPFYTVSTDGTLLSRLSSSARYAKDLTIEYTKSTDSPGTVPPLNWIIKY